MIVPNCLDRFLALKSVTSSLVMLSLCVVVRRRNLEVAGSVRGVTGTLAEPIILVRIAAAAALPWGETEVVVSYTVRCRRGPPPRRARREEQACRGDKCAAGTPMIPRGHMYARKF